MIKLIQLADLLGTDSEYIATGRHSEVKSSPTVVTMIQKVDHIVEKVVEKPVEIEKIVDSVKLDAVKEAFGAVTTVDAGISGEFAVITEEMSQENFEEKIKGFDGVVNTIRTEL